uniref:Ribosome biogenesis protein NOP53 n=1 Tax=Globodera rostochiensis TaxID=31243 RepID=A0A914HZG1_GLORO
MASISSADVDSEVASNSKKTIDDIQSLDEFPVYSSKVRAFLSQVDDSELLHLDFDLTTYINTIFPSEQSLVHLDFFGKKVDEEIANYDRELSEAVAAHGRCALEANNALLQAHTTIAELEQKVQEIRDKTLCSESSVHELTKDIRQLDVAKKNLTESIATLHHLHLLLNGVNSLTQWVIERRYRDIAVELPAVLNVLLLFEDYQHIEHVKQLTDKVQKIREQLTVQLAADLKAAFKAGQVDQQISEMCRVVSVLGGKLQDDFIKWFISQQLAIYTVLYAESEDVAWLDRIEERYRWFVDKLAEFERRGVVKIFPPQWEMGRKLALEFCTITRMTERRRVELDWKLVSHAINHTQMFEQLLTKRFPTKDIYNFEKVIWPVFDSHMDIFVIEQRGKLLRFLDECSLRIRSGEEKPQREAHATAVQLPSAANLFLLVKKIITESTKLFADPNAVLSKLVELFRQCLRQFGHGCLSAFLPQTISGVTPGAGGIISASSSILQNLIRDDSVVRLDADQTFFTCCVLATADWSAETTMQLQEKLGQRISSEDFEQEIDLFHSICNNALMILVQDTEAMCEPCLQAMSKINWSSIDQVGDESSYVSTIRKNLRASVPLIRDYFSDRRKYFAHFCLKLATQLVNRFLGAIFKCRPISIAGAEQLLLDTHSLKTFLLNLPSVESAIVTKPPTQYTAILNKGMTKAEMILKALMADKTNQEEFVAHFARILPDSDAAELQRILEMRPIRKTEQNQIIRIYKTKIEDANPLMGSTVMTKRIERIKHPMELWKSGDDDEMETKEEGEQKYVGVLRKKLRKKAHGHWTPYDIWENEGCTNKAAKGKRKKRVEYVPNLLPAVVPPPEGMSYNPPVDSYLKMAEQFAKEELKLERKRRRTERRIGLSIAETAAMPSLREEIQYSAKWGGVKRECEVKDEGGDREEEEEKEERIKVNPKPKTIRAKKRRKLRSEEATKKHFEKEVGGRMRRQLESLKSLKSEVLKESEALEKRQIFKKRERALKALTERKRLGRGKFEPFEEPILTVDELPAKLRQLSPQGNVLQERLKSLQRRNILPIAGEKQQPNLKARLKFKLVEKRSVKEVNEESRVI